MSAVDATTHESQTTEPGTTVDDESTDAATTTAVDASGSSEAAADGQSSDAASTETTGEPVFCGDVEIPPVALGEPAWLEPVLGFRADLEVDRLQGSVVVLDPEDNAIHLWDPSGGTVSADLDLPVEVARLGGGDLDGDGDFDLVVANEDVAGGDPAMFFFLRDGTAWIEAATFDLGPDGAMDATVDDILGDSDAEVVVTTRSSVQVYNVSDTLELALADESALDDVYSSGDIVVHDLNDDANDDLIAHGWYVLLGQGDTFSEPETIAATGGFARPGDIDGDGNPDLVYLSVTDLFAVRSLRALHGYGDGTFDIQKGEPYLAQACFSEPVVGDFNADGATDFMVPTICEHPSEDGDAELHFWLGCPDGSLVEVVLAYPDGVVRAQAADLDDDGRPDLTLLGPTELSNGVSPATSARVGVLLSSAR